MRITNFRIVVSCIYLFIFLAAFYSWGQPDPIASKFGQLVTEAGLREKLTILASDALEGRATGTRGHRMAAAMISQHFEDIGLKGPVNGSCFQQIPFYQSKMGENQIKTEGHEFQNLEDFVYVGYGNENEPKATVVFGGNGSVAVVNILDVKDKVVLIINENPGNSVIETILQRGAKLVFICNRYASDEFEKMGLRLKRGFETFSMRSERPGVSAITDKMVYVSPDIVEKLFGVGFNKIKALASDDAKPSTIRKIKQSVISYQFANEIREVNIANVLGYLEGSDKKEELLVITAHYDHIGKREGSSGDLINNGADDDGSGTVAVMEIASAFAKAKKAGHGPRRSILFMTVTAEEIGLLGSRYYVDHPVFPLNSTMVNLNIDMIGRSDESHLRENTDYVYVIGSDKLSQDLHQVSEKVNADYSQLNFDYTYNDVNHPTNLYKRSDHWNFAKNNIPIIFYFDGIHEDYHQPSDEVDKIDFDLLSKRTRLVFYTAWELANRERTIKPD